MTPAQSHPLFRMRTKPSHTLNGIQSYLVWIDYWNGKKWVDSQCNFPMQSIPDWVAVELEKRICASHSSANGADAVLEKLKYKAERKRDEKVWEAQHGWEQEKIVCYYKGYLKAIAELRQRQERD
jgi:hypothetical protein